MCKAILVDEKNRNAALGWHGKKATAASANASAANTGIIATLSTQGATGGVPLDLVARCARDALAAVRVACDDGRGGCNATGVALAVHLVESEALPQAGRWHRRDLAPALAAAWHAVLRALRRAEAGHGGAHSAHPVTEPT